MAYIRATFTQEGVGIHTFAIYDDTIMWQCSFTSQEMTKGSLLAHALRRTRASTLAKVSFLPSEVVKKRTFHYFMSTGATEKSPHSHDVSDSSIPAWFASKERKKVDTSSSIRVLSMNAEKIRKPGNKGKSQVCFFFCHVLSRLDWPDKLWRHTVATDMTTRECVLGSVAAWTIIVNHVQPHATCDQSVQVQALLLTRKQNYHSYNTEPYGVRETLAC